MARKIVILMSPFLASLFIISCSLEEFSRDAELAPSEAVDPCGDNLLVRDIFGPDQYERGKGKPSTIKSDFYAPFVGNYCILIENGDHDPPHGRRVSSAVISIDGNVVVGPDSFNQQVDLVKQTVHLEGWTNHVLEVQLRSKPGSYIILSLRGVPDDLEPPVINLSNTSDNIITQSSSVIFSGMISDNIGVSESKIIVNGTESLLDLEPNGFFRFIVQLDVGEGDLRSHILNSIEVVATDRAGNYAKESRDVGYMKYYDPQKLIVSFKRDTTDDTINQINDGLGAEILVESRLPNTYTVLVPSGVELNDAINYYKSSNVVKWAVRDWLYFGAFTPNDPIFSSWPGLPEYGQRHLTNTNFDDAWDFERGSKDVVVGVIEAGFDYKHPDLEGNLWINRGEDLNGNGSLDLGEDRFSDCGTGARNGILDSWEDVNHDGILDPLEDKNGNGKLDTSEDINNNGSYDTWSSADGGDLDGIDNDMNGYIDDVVGYAFDDTILPFEPDDLYDHNPMGGVSSSGHGTAVAGIIGAVGNNNEGVAGTNIEVSIMLLNVGHIEGGQSRDASLEAICYAIDNGAKIINHSYGYDWVRALRDLPVIDLNDPYLGLDFSSEFEHFENADAAGLLSVVSAGNGIKYYGIFNTYDPNVLSFLDAIWPMWYEKPYLGKDNDILSYPGFYPELPASFPFDSIISVAATDHKHRLTTTSNFGRNSVDVAAPGWSTFVAVPYPTYPCRFDVWRFPDNYNYGFFSGTSSAAPHVSGLAALIMAVNPDLTALEVKEKILSTVQPIKELTLWEYLEDVGFIERLFDPKSNYLGKPLIEMFGIDGLQEIVNTLRNNEYMNRERPISTGGEIDAHAAVMAAWIERWAVEGITLPKSEGLGGLEAAFSGDITGDGSQDIVVMYDYVQNLFNMDSGAMVIVGDVTGIPVVLAEVDINNFSAEFPEFHDPLIPLRNLERLGDVNGDGIEDFAIGTPAATDATGLKGRGVVNIFFGNPYFGTVDEPGYLVLPDLLLVEPGMPTEYGAFGMDVLNLGDINNDGNIDILVTAYKHKKAYIYLGPFDTPGVINSPEAVLDGNKEMIDSFGYSSAFVDYNGDLIGDIGISGSIIPYSASVFFFDGSSLSGLLKGQSPIYLQISKTLVMNDIGPLPGGVNYPDTSLSAGLGKLESADVTGDGIDELIVSLQTYLNHESIFTSRGTVIVLLGQGSGLFPVVPEFIEPPLAFAPLPEYEFDYRSQTLFGLSIKNVGDVNLDGKEDILIGDPRGYLYSLPDFGTAFIYFGSDEPFNGSNSFKYELLVPPFPPVPVTSNDVLSDYHYGSSVDGGLDVNGNSIPDILVSAYGGSDIDLSRTFLFIQ